MASIGGKTRHIAVVVVVLALALVARPTRADPPEWAPAHGWRQHHERHDDDDRAPPHRSREREYRGDEERDHVGIQTGRCDRGVVGGLLGGAAGAALGAQFGRGNGRVAAAVVGAVLGYLTGTSIGRSMDRVDRYCLGTALARAPDDRTIVWRDRSTGTSYRVTPRATVRTSAGRECREYTMQALIAGRRRQTRGMACRQPDGSWQIVSRNAS